MIGGSSARNLLEECASWHLVAATLAAILLLVMGVVGEAAACPPGTKSHHAAVKHKAKSAAVTAHVPVSGKSAAKDPALIGHRCGGISSSAGSSCKASCCSAGLVIDATPDGLRYTELPISYFSCVQGDLPSLAPAPHFRPPQAI